MSWSRSAGRCWWREGEEEGVEGRPGEGVGGVV